MSPIPPSCTCCPPIGGDVLFGLLADIPAADASNEGVFYFATDTGELYLSDGVTFNLVSSGGGGCTCALDDLSDVDITGAVAGSVLFTPDGINWEETQNIQFNDLLSTISIGLVDLNDGGGILGIGTPVDATNYRAGGSIDAFTAPQLGTISDVLLSGGVTGDVESRFEVLADGTVSWGDGTNPLDTILARTGVAHLAMSSGIFQADLLWANASVVLLANATLDATAGLSATSAVLNAGKATDAALRYRINRSGTHTWGDGTNPVDVQLSRGSADVLATPDRFEATDGVTTKVTAGPPVDGDFAQTPVDGTMVLDSTNERLYVRVGGAWKYSALV